MHVHVKTRSSRFFSQEPLARKIVTFKPILKSCSLQISAFCALRCILNKEQSVVSNAKVEWTQNTINNFSLFLFLK